MRDPGLKFLRCEVAAVRLRQRHAVFVHVVAVGALDLRDLVTATGHHGDHVDPEDVLHPGAGDGAGVLLGEGIQTVDLRRGGVPWIDGLFAGGDHVDAAGHALFHVVVDVLDEAEERDDGHVRVALIQHLICVVGDEDARLDAELRPITDVHPDDLRIDVDGADDLGAVLVSVPKGLLAHLAAPILNDFDLFHSDSAS